MSLLLSQLGGGGSTETIDVSPAAITITGGTVTVTDTIPVAAAPIAQTRGTVTVTDTVPVSAAAITQTRGTVTVSDIIPVAAAGPSIASGTVSVTDTVAIAAAAITLTAGSIVVTDTVPVGQASVGVAGGNVTIEDFINTVQVTPASITVTGGTVTVVDSEPQQENAGGYIVEHHSTTFSRKRFYELLEELYGARQKIEAEAPKKVLKAAVERIERAAMLLAKDAAVIPAEAREEINVEVDAIRAAAAMSDLHRIEIYSLQIIAAVNIVFMRIEEDEEDIETILMLL